MISPFSLALGYSSWLYHGSITFKVPLPKLAVKTFEENCHVILHPGTVSVKSEGQFCSIANWGVAKCRAGCLQEQLRSFGTQLTPHADERKQVITRDHTNDFAVFDHWELINILFSQHF